MKEKVGKNRPYSNLEVLTLAIAFDKSQQTIKRWIASKDDILTSERAKSALKSIKNNKIKIY